MKLANGIIAVTLATVFTGSLAVAQNATTPAKPETEVRTFYLSNVVMQTDGFGNSEGTELREAIRNAVDSHDNVYLDYSQNAIVVRAGNPDDFATVQKLIADLDRPHKSYRLTYTVTEMAGAKRIDAQHFAMVLAPSQRTTLSESSKVPIATGSYSSGAPGAGVQTQFTYNDVGITFDATVTEMGKGVRLQSKVQQTSVALPDQPDAKTDTVLRPVTRNASLEGASYLTAGKPLVLGSLDIPGSTRHLEVEVVMEEVR